MEVLTIEAVDLGNRSYLLTDGHRAMVVDPPRPADAVLDIVRRRGLQLDLIVETHLHNDHVSGGPELAEATGACYAVCADERVSGARGLMSGEQFQIGAVRVAVVATPGHTPHHQSFVARHGAQYAVFSGGSLLSGTVGRTDLLGADLTVGLAGAQWESVRRLLDDLPGETIVHPTHGFGSFCAATPATGTETTIANERQTNPAARLDREPFVATLLAGLGEYPDYYAHMAELNRAGQWGEAYRTAVPALRPEDLPEMTAGTWVVDVRPRAEFAPSHLPGSINAGVDGSLAVYLGWAMPWGTPFVLVAADDRQLARARNALAHIGLDLPVASVVLPAKPQPGRLRRATFRELAAEWTQEITVVDVRRRQEWDEAHLAGAHHIALHELLDATLPAGQLWLHCAAGYRATLGASVLQRQGREVVAVDDTWASASAAGLPIARS